MGFIMKILYDQGQDELAHIFEEYLLVESIPMNQLVHVVFGLSGNDASAALEADLRSCSNSIEQHAIALYLPDHQEFIASVYERLNNYARSIEELVTRINESTPPGYRGRLLARGLA
jgi:hypothetical protein